MNIDWSKAPEGATHRAKDSRCYNTEGIQFYRLRPGERYQYFNPKGEWVYGGLVSDTPNVVFFPLSNTPFSTEERDRAVAEMVKDSILADGSSIWFANARKLYEAGYRKQVAS